MAHNDIFHLDVQAMDFYEKKIYKQTLRWIKNNTDQFGLFDFLASSIQNKINNIIPQKVHDVITVAIREAIKGLLFGSKFIAPQARNYMHIHLAEMDAKKHIQTHKLTAAAEGGLTGAGGFLWSLADFPLLLSIKIKLLQDIAAIYGYDGSILKEKIFILKILQAAFSSDKIQSETIKSIIEFDTISNELPEHINELDWQTLQQQYRDYLDIAKLLQMVPVIGAVVGTVTNYRLLNRLGKVAMCCYRVRYFQHKSFNNS